MPRKLNPNLAKIHRNYTISEIADLFGVCKSTVRGWIKQGLQLCDKKRPLLILGTELRRFLVAQREARKTACQANELFCMRCRLPRVPIENRVEFIRKNETTGRLLGTCPRCNSTMHRFVSDASLQVIQQKMDVCFARQEKHLNQSNNPHVNTHFNQGEKR